MTREQLSLEIEAARRRQAWARSGIERFGDSPALEKYLIELAAELVDLLKRKADD
jgi:hypothetical protein